MTRPIEAAVAFANLYQQWFDDARELAAANKRQIQSIRGLYVADVLALWDEGARDYLAGAPTVLRLETCDLAVFVMKAPYLALHVGSIETDAPVAKFAAQARTCASLKPAVQWKSFRPCSYAIGRKLSDLVFCADESRQLVELEAILDDGGRLTFSGSQSAGSPSGTILGTWKLPRAV